MKDGRTDIRTEAITISPSLFFKKNVGILIWGSTTMNLMTMQEAKVKNPFTTQGNGCHYHNRCVPIITVGNVTGVTRCGVDKHEISLYPIVSGNRYIVKLYSLVTLVFCTWTQTLMFEMIYWRNFSYDNMFGKDNK